MNARTRTSSSARAWWHEIRTLLLIGLIVIVIAFAIRLALVHIEPLAHLVEQGDWGDKSQTWRIGPLSPTSLWRVPLGLSGAAAVAALVYGIITGSMSRVSIAAGMTRRAVVRDDARFLATVVLALTALMVLAMLPALVLEPAPALREGFLHPAVAPLRVFATAAAAAMLGQLIALLFLRFPWFVGVLACAVLLGLTGLSSLVDALPPLAELLVSLGIAALVAVLALVISRRVAAGLEV